MQVIIDADTKLVVAAARPVPGNTADAKAWRDSGLARPSKGVTVLGDGAYINTGLVVPHRKRPGRALLPGEEEGNAGHRKVRARVGHAFARMITGQPSGARRSGGRQGSDRGPVCHVPASAPAPMLMIRQLPPPVGRWCWLVESADAAHGSPCPARGSSCQSA